MLESTAEFSPAFISNKVGEPDETSETSPVIEPRSVVPFVMSIVPTTVEQSVLEAIW